MSQKYPVAITETLSVGCVVSVGEDGFASGIIAGPSAHSISVRGVVRSISDDGRECEVAELTGAELCYKFLDDRTELWQAPLGASLADLKAGKYDDQLELLCSVPK